MRAKKKNQANAFGVSFVSFTKSEAVQNSRHAPRMRNRVSIMGDISPLSRCFDIGINIPNIVFAVRTQRCPFTLSGIIVFGSL